MGVVYQLKLDEEKEEVKGEGIVCVVYLFFVFSCGRGEETLKNGICVCIMSTIINSFII